MPQYFEVSGRWKVETFSTGSCSYHLPYIVGIFSKGSTTTARPFQFIPSARITIHFKLAGCEPKHEIGWLVTQKSFAEEDESPKVTDVNDFDIVGWHSILRRRPTNFNDSSANTSLGVILSDDVAVNSRNLHARHISHSLGGLSFVWRLLVPTTFSSHNSFKIQ